MASYELLPVPPLFVKPDICSNKFSMLNAYSIAVFMLHFLLFLLYFIDKTILT